MARYIGPKSRIARRFGEAILVLTKYFQSAISLLVSMEILVAASHLNTVSCWLRSRRLSILMVF